MTTATSAMTLREHLKKLRLPTMSEYHEHITREAQANEWSYEQYLLTLCETELEGRHNRKIERISRQSGLPYDKTLLNLNTDFLCQRVQRQLPLLCTGEFVQNNENVLVFGLPGLGKTHLVCAIGHELMKKGLKILFLPAFKLVQRLLIAKRELLLEKELRKLDRYAVVIIDDIGYVQQTREEMEVLFTFLSERYERRSVMITSNLVFSQWDKIFKDQMVTACAIDRLVHHAVILELTGVSYRAESAKKRVAK